MSTAGPRYTPGELLGLARRAEAEGQLQYAVRLYSYLAVEEIAPGEAFEARRALERLTTQPHPQTQVAAQSSHQPHSPAPGGHAAVGPMLTISPIPHTVDPPVVPVTGTVAAAPSSPWVGPASPGPQKRETTGAAADPALRRTAEAVRPPPAEPSGWDLGRAPAAGLPPAQLSYDDDDDRTPLPRLVRPEAAEEIDEIIAAAIPGYRTGRLVAALLTILGWLGLLLALALISGTFAGSARMLTAPDPMIGLPFGFLLAAGALALASAAMLVGQIARALFDIAASNRELTEIQRLRSGW